MTMLTGTPDALPDPRARVFDGTEAPADQMPTPEGHPISARAEARC